MGKGNSFATLIFIVIFGLGGGLAYAINSIGLGVIALIIALVFSLPIKIADQWEEMVILRLGKFRALKEPGLFFIIPIIDTIPFCIDTRVITTSFNAEKTLTKMTALTMGLGQEQAQKEPESPVEHQSLNGGVEL